MHIQLRSHPWHHPQNDIAAAKLYMWQLLHHTPTWQVAASSPGALARAQDRILNIA